MYKRAKIICGLLLINIVSTTREITSPRDCIRITVQHHLRNKVRELVDSFKSFAQNVKTYLNLPLNKLNDRKKGLQNQVAKLFKEPSNEDIEKINMMQNASGRDEFERVILQEPKLINGSGFRSERYTVLTADGYQLTLHRIVQSSFRNQTKIALLHHGLLGSSIDWLLLGNEKALPYLLSVAGYDVWIANARGNRFSRKHISRNVDSFEFWNFSWHEMGHFDLAAIIDRIREITKGSSQIDFIGYSLGATALLALLTTLPRYNFLVRSATFLAPLVFMHSARGPIKDLAEMINKHGLENLNYFGIHEFMTTEQYPQQFLDKHCKGDMELCVNPLLFLANGGKLIPEQNIRKNILKHVPAGGSTKTIAHYCQLVNSVHFQMFDFGVYENVKKYGVKSPPVYRLDDVTIPIAVFTSLEDWLSAPADASTLMQKLPRGVKHHIIKQRGFSHTDFLWSLDAPILVYCHLINVLDEIVSINKTFRRDGGVIVYTDKTDYCIL